MENGAVQIYYGEGHGKTNVAIGSAISAACEGKQAVIIQFLKGKNEQEFLSRLEPEVKFFNFSRAGILFEQLDEDSRQEEIMNIKNGFNYAKKVVSTGADTVVVLDEILGLLDLHLITRDELADLLASKPDDVTVIMTGRVLDDSIRDLADEIYNIAPEK
ncbi:cob(I)yrinic acid a,c-diamide adenosyltransferase [Agathobacter sp.]